MLAFGLLIGFVLALLNALIVVGGIWCYWDAGRVNFKVWVWLGLYAMTLGLMLGCGIGIGLNIADNG